ncbi:hypothetical protein Tco_1418866 [Tanacetum coccineum]
MAAIQAVKYAPQCGDRTVESVQFQSNNFAIKAEPANIGVNEALVINENYSSTKQLNSIRQLLAYSLLTGTKMYIREIIYSDLVTRLMAKSRQKYISYPRFVSCALEVLLVTPLPFSIKKVKKKSQTVSQPKPKTQGPKASSTASKEEKFQVQNDIPSGQCTRSSKPLPEGKSTDPKDLKGNTQPVDMGLPVNHPDEDPDHNKGKTSSEVDPDTKTLLLTTVTDIQALLGDSEEELKNASDDYVFEAGEEMEEDIQEPDTKETQTHHSTKTLTKEPLSTEH